MTESEKSQPAEKAQVSGLGKLLTAQTLLQTIVLLIPILGFYYKTNDRLDNVENAQKRNGSALRYHNDWLTNLSIKTGVTPPSPESQSEN